MRRLSWSLLIGLVGLVAAAVAIPSSSASRASDRDGELWVYLLPFPSDASRLTFRFSEIRAVTADGTAVPLDLTGDGSPEQQSSRMHKLAGGGVPPGQYRGLEIRVADAVLMGEEGPANLIVPDEPVLVDVPFRIRKREAIVLELRFAFRGSVTEDVRFVPKFVAEKARQPAVGLLGLATSPAAQAVSIFDKASGRMVGVIPVDGSPMGMALDAERKRVHVATPDEDSLLTIDLLESQTINRTRGRAGDAPTEVALTPDGRTLLLANSGSRTVSFVDTGSLTETDRTEVGDEPRSIIVSGDGNRAYVFNTASSSVTVIDVPGRRRVGTVGTDAGPFRGQLDRDGETLYVIHRSSLKISLVDTETLVVRSQVYVGSGALELAVDPQTDLVYLSRRGTGEIEIFDPFSLLPVASIPVAGDVTRMTIDPELNLLYALVPASREVHGFSLVGNRLEVRSEVGDDPFWIVVSGEK